MGERGEFGFRNAECGTRGKELKAETLILLRCRASIYDVTRRRDEKAETSSARGLWLNPIGLVVKTAWGKELATANPSERRTGSKT